MITKDEMLPLLVDACPSFADKWQAHKLVYYDEDAFLPYIALGEFASHLVELKGQSRTDEFDAVFTVVEQLHLEGDAYVKEAVTLGLLEGIQNMASNQAFNSADVLEYLTPTSAKWWIELNKFWNGEVKYVGENFK